MARRARTLSLSLLLLGALLPAPASAAPRTCGTQIFGPVTHQGTDGDDHIVGTDGPDVIDAGAGDDTIEGLGGDDRICAQGGNDRIEAGDGNDYISGSAGNDRLDGGPGNDELEPGEGNDRLIGGSGSDIAIYDPVGAYESPYYQRRGVVVNLTRGFSSGQGDDTLTSIENVDGTFGKDRIIGTTGPNLLIGHEGGDFIDGKAGDDEIRAGRGADTVYAGKGNDYVTAHKVKVDNRIKRIYLGPGGDTLTSYMGSQMKGGGGRDLLSFADYNLRGNRPGVLADMASGEASSGDESSTFTGFEDLEGSAGPDRLYGDASDNVIRGLGDDDYLDGRDGNDQLDGGSGLGDSCFNGETQVNCE